MGALFCLSGSCSSSAAEPGLATSPYPPSPVIAGLTWHWDTYRTAAPGSDLWPVTWAADGNLYAAWGDGGGFGGSDSDGRVAMGFARLEGSPETFIGINVNGGKNGEHPASFPQKGKTGGILSLQGTLWASINLQDGTWPNVHHVLAWSTNYGAGWTKADWMFSNKPGEFQPAKFLQFGKDYAGAPRRFAGYAYLYGPKQNPQRGSGDELFLARVPIPKLLQRDSYEFYAGRGLFGQSKWVSTFSDAKPVFVDHNGLAPAGAVYVPALKRFLLTSFHCGPGQLGVFDGPTPWGPWTQVAYYEDWGKMGVEGEGLICGFPAKWMSQDGQTLWCVFSVYGAGAKQGIHAHDRFNLVKVSLNLRKHPAASH
jgi:hypothetical protein